MKSRAIVPSIAASLAAFVLAVNTTSAQPWIAIAGGAISNPNAPGGNVGINVGPPAPPSTACDPLEVGSAGAPAAVRLTGVGAAGPCGTICNYAQLGFDPGGFFLPIGAPNSLAIGTQGCANDVVIGTNGAVGGFIRLATGGAGGLTERVTIDNTGLVGINNPAPTQALDVTGTINVTQDILLGNKLQANGSFGSPNDVLTLDAAGIPTWAPGTSNAWIYGGNGVTAVQTLGTTTNFALPFITNNTTRMTIAAGGNVGIGTGAPTEALHVTGNVRFSGALMPNNAAGTAGQVLQSNGPGAPPTWVAAPAPANAWTYGGNTNAAIQFLGTLNAGIDLPIYAGGTEQIRLDATNNRVGIGTTTPAQKLDVVGNVQFSGALMPGGSAGSTTQILQSTGAGTAPVWVSPSSIVNANAWGLGGNSGTTAGTNYMGTSDNQDVVFKAYAAETMRLVSSGTAGTVGQVVVGGGTVGTDRFRVNGNSYFNGNATISGTLTVLSDARLKENVVTLDNALEKVLALRGVSYDFRPEEHLNLPQTHQIGFIAQEVEKVVPEVVNLTSDGYKGVSYQNLVALLVESTKEQQGIIEAQRSTIDDLNTRLARLEAMVDPSFKPTTPATVNEMQGVQLEQNTPNPFDRSTTIRYVVPETIGSAEMVIFESATGREVERFIIAGRGEGEVTVSVAGLASGSYVYGIVADGRLAQTRTMVVAR